MCSLRSIEANAIKPDIVQQSQCVQFRDKLYRIKTGNVIKISQGQTVQMKQLREQIKIIGRDLRLP
ncbi:hypothetical protein ACO0LG_16820 [Undibacterium sp. Ji42W]|uniref:hypothetical protein n=1 Tax=Undibacterium sp. Ji42W TaxID=3413039 RepID=UPI003BF19C1F